MTSKCLQSSDALIESSCCDTATASVLTCTAVLVLLMPQRRLENGMPCQNQKQVLNTEKRELEHAAKQVRFAERSDGSVSASATSARGEAGGEPVCDHGNEDTSGSDAAKQIGPQLKLLPLNDQIRELQTIIRDKSTSRGDFVFSADRLIRLVVEEGLNQLPYSECTVITPTGHKYEGVKFEKGNCGVSIMRSGEAMEQGLRDCCRSIRIGKILIQSDEETQKAKVFYAKFPPDISRRKVLLMYPILSTGNTVIEAVRVLKEHGLQAKHIILLSLFSTPHGARSIVKEFPDITILTTEVHAVAPTHFGQRYFGTD
ncbi:uracil phosphoribosyltransferase-like [Silurus asotus]|uniref:Uracil phosphoribosyltransferase homolog n=1 Tax=Silurus asotus TaxID=30991 RepID=A0AAD5B923_SILAS|nr:uracil phosphoribosyltransferase-like [Silurus asotus]